MAEKYCTLYFICRKDPSDPYRSKELIDELMVRHYTIAIRPKYHEHTCLWATCVYFRFFLRSK